jgi:lysophospholipase L1-like esterase
MNNKHMLLVSILPSVILLLLLLTSIGLNIILYRQGYEYYSQLNETRLDPFGLNAFLTEKPQNTHSNKRRLVVFVGDSRAADWAAPTQVANFTFINRGINGQTTAQVLGRFAHHALSLKPDILVLQVGINDLKSIPLFPDKKATIVTQCKANIQEIIELAAQSNTRVILTTIFPMGLLSIERRLFWSDDVVVALNDVNRFIIGLANDRVKILDAAKILSNQKGVIDPLYSKDFLHLNEVGYEVLNRELTQILPR